MYEIFKQLALPPASLLLLLAIGLVICAAGRRRLGLSIAGVCLAAFYLLSTPLVAGYLTNLIQADRPLREEDLDQSNGGPAQAIVVLSAGLLADAPEYGSAIVDEITLQRLSYAAYLWRRYKLPILVSGGYAPDAESPLARLMKESLEQVFDVPVTWTEGRSANTYENAIFSAELLKEQGVSRIILITHAFHMRRSERLFRAAGFSVIPAPTIFNVPRREFPGSFLPRQSALQNSYYAFYELLGAVWYALHGDTVPRTEITESAVTPP